MLNYRQLPDSELASLLKEGNRKAFSVIFRRYHSLLYQHAYRMLGDDTVAEDIVQEVFQYVWVKKEQLEFHKSLAAYLYQATRHAVLNEIKHAQRQQKHLRALAESMDGIGTPADERIRLKQLQAIIEREIDLLPPRMREIFNLRRDEELSYKDIASRLGISDVTVKTQLHKASKLLRQKVLYGYLIFIFGSSTTFLSERCHNSDDATRRSTAAH